MRALLLGTALALAACTSGSGQGPTSSTAQAGRSDKMICRMEQPTGSSISREVCRTPEQMEADRKAADDMFRKTHSRPGVSNR
jgi:hypothetical protein